MKNKIDNSCNNQEKRLVLFKLPCKTSGAEKDLDTVPRVAASVQWGKPTFRKVFLKEKHSFLMNNVLESGTKPLVWLQLRFWLDMIISTNPLQILNVKKVLTHFISNYISGVKTS